MMIQVVQSPSPLYKLRPCESYTGRRDRINLGFLCSLYKGGGVQRPPPPTARTVF